MLSDRPCACRVIATAVIAIVATTTACAQRYESDPVDKSLSSRGSLFRNFVRQPSGSADQEAEFKAYITKYYLPAMTLSTEDGLEDLGKLRSDLFARFLWPARPTLQNWITGEAFTWAKRVATSGKYHPAVQYNALYLMGMLDDRYDNTSPAPLPAANEMLNKYVGAAATQPKYPRRLLAGALLGLERHTRYFANLPEANRTQTARSLMGVLRAKALAGDYEKPVLGWIYITAAQGLANTGSAGPRGAFFNAVAQRASDKKLSLADRAEIASQLARMKAEKGSFNAAPAAAAIRGLAAKIATEEAKIASEFEDMRIGNGGAMGQIGLGRDNKARRIREGEDDLELVRTDLLALLTNLRKAVRAVGAVSDGADASSLGKIDQAVASAITSASDKSQIDLNVAASIKQMASAIKDAVASVKPPAEEAPAEEVGG